LACSVPVLASDAGALPEAVVPGANGALFRAGSGRDLRRRLRELVEEPEALHALASFPPAKTIDAHAAELAALYETVAAPRLLAR
ncbi:MAG TPA: glycosyltransferase, partial [Gaiellaceae bacterium]|nr:glycosyltransferase [Gaiellaceae bacterium]